MYLFLRGIKLQYFSNQCKRLIQSWADHEKQQTKKKTFTHREEKKLVLKKRNPNTNSDSPRPNLRKLCLDEKIKKRKEKKLKKNMKKKICALHNH